MTARTIETLSACIKPKDAVAGQCLPDTRVISEIGDQELVAKLAQYAYCYSDVWFGWEFAAYTVKHPEIPFPTYLHGDDHYLWRAHCYLKTDGKNKDRVIKKALSLTSPAFSQVRIGIESMLLSRDMDEGIYHDIATYLGMKEEVIRAFEKLFFNVVDRRRDHAFIASLVMPEGRLAETKPGYWKETTQELLLRRTAYEKGIDTIKYMIGIVEDNPMIPLDASAAAGELNKQLMNTALFYSMLGAYNTPQVEAGRKAVQAALANQANPMGDSASAPVEDSIRQDLLIMSQNVAAMKNRKQAFDANKVFQTESSRA